ncbi:PKD domain protein [Mucilaginibacter gotjawali]|uniref:PKD domain protein n=1 Tax=Mucilaginibacter gotjawali TaxID=1550579 RepID=A0A0X8X3E7_9SPHI|nr:PKD domain-containing protein [Mucilaginibacter gotjawali]BAU54916.1 PKD domain protein [Mucilaginibacter gotjawali]
MSVGNVSLPIALSYGTNGVKATDIEGSAGMGWNLIAGGAVTREVRGTPDDILIDLGYMSRAGWMSGTVGNTINNMTIYNSTNPPNYPMVAADVNFIHNNFGDNSGAPSDTEPDIFNVSAPGLSVQFVFDKDHNIRTIPYQDLKIAYAYNSAGEGAITSFTITNDQGITYVFAAAESTTKKSVNPATPSWFNTGYQEYIDGITYNSAWRLTQIHDLNNNTININYTAGTEMPSTNKVQVYLNGYTTPTTLYSVWQKTTPELLSSITYQEGNGTGSPVTAFNFTYNNNSYTKASYINTITGFGRSFQFNYTANVHSGNNFTRYFLTNVTDPDCNTPVNYTFAYKNLANMPDSSTVSMDYWGYINKNTSSVLLPTVCVNPSNTSYDRYAVGPLYNPSVYSIKLQSSLTDGTNRVVDTGAVQTGLLNQINYPTGGYSIISYEPNTIYASILGDDVLGAGVRVKQISSYDGINASPSVTSYSYLDPTNFQSSGKALSLPQYAFTQVYTSSEADSVKWRKSTVISLNDLSQDDHTVIYNYVKESRTGAGSTLYQFSVPASQWDSSTPSGAPSWSPTMTYSGSPTTNTIGFMSNIMRSYPFVPSTNYDFERGLPLDITNYDNNNNKVSETTYTYNTPQTPVTITAFKYDSNTSAEESYGKYYIYTTAGPLTTQVVSKLYSATAPTTYRQTTSNYTYSGSMYKLSQESTTNSDGTAYNKYFKYVKDYTVTTAGDGMTQALLNLQAANVNAPVEEYAQVTPSGGSATTVSAALTTYGVFTPSGYSGSGLTLPAAYYKVSTPGGMTLTPSSISTASPNTFVFDSDYIKVGHELAYDYSGYLLSADNGFRDTSTVLIDHNSFQPAATVSNARYDEIAFSDFDSNLPYVNFTGTTTLSSTSRSGQYSNSLAAGATLTKTVSRNLMAVYYVVSAWVQRSTTPAGTLTATVASSDGTVSHSQNKSYVATTGNTTFPTGWQYLEVKVPLTSIATSTINITISCSTAVLIDDVWAYPDVSQVSSVTYDPVAFFKTSATNTNGVASYFSYDKFGRMLYAFDQDKNIVQRKIYASAANEANFTAPALSGPASAYNNISSTWNMAAPSYNTCVTAAGVTYTWNFGDGSAKVVTTSTSPVSHSYATNGNYTITLTASSPAYGSKASTLAVTVSALSQVNLTYNNYTSGSSITSVVFKKHTTGATIYTLTTAQLTAGYNIIPDVYDITINTTGPLYNSGTGLGFLTIALTGNNGLSNCLSYSSTNVITVTSVDLTSQPAVNFSMYHTVCP